jgi:hypothetical protein
MKIETAKKSLAILQGFFGRKLSEALPATPRSLGGDITFVRKKITANECNNKLPVNGFRTRIVISPT